MSRTLTVQAYLYAKQGQEARLLAELVAMREPSLAEAGCIAYQAYVNATDARRIAMLEEWTDKAALDAHFETPHFKRLASQLEGLLAEPLKIDFFSRIAQE